MIIQLEKNGKAFSTSASLFQMQTDYRHHSRKEAPTGFVLFVQSTWNMLCKYFHVLVNLELTVSFDKSYPLVLVPQYEYPAAASISM